MEMKDFNASASPTEAFLLRLKNFKRFIIFGASSGGETVVKQFPFPISYFIDNDQNKWGQLVFNHYFVYKPEIVLREDDSYAIIISSSTYYQQIAKQLENMGLIENYHYFSYYHLKLKPDHSSYFPEIEEKGFTLLKSSEKYGRILINHEKELVYRGVYPEYSPLFFDVYQKVRDNEMIFNYIVETSMENHISFSPFNLILKHKYIKGLTSPAEWSNSMVFKAIKTLMDFMIELDKNDLCLIDSHLFNVGYVGFKPTWIDFFGILPRDFEDSSYDELLQKFLNYIIHPLILFMKGNQSDANYYFKDITRIISTEEVLGVLLNQDREQYISNFKQVSRLFNNKEFRSGLEFLKSWTIIYLDACVESDNKQISSCKLDHCIKEILSSFFRRSESNLITIVDPLNRHGELVKCKAKGHFNLISNSTLNFDNTLTSLDNSDISFSLCVVNLLEPINSFHEIRILSQVITKLKGDFLIFLDYIHQLIFFQQNDFEEIVELFDNAANIGVVFDFWNTNHPAVQYWMHERNEYFWYSYESFKKVLIKRFLIIEEYLIDNGRKHLVVCRKGD